MQLWRKLGAISTPPKKRPPLKTIAHEPNEHVSCCAVGDLSSPCNCRVRGLHFRKVVARPISFSYEQHCLRLIQSRSFQPDVHDDALLITGTLFLFDFYASVIANIILSVIGVDAESVAGTTTKISINAVSVSAVLQKSFFVVF